MALKPPAQHPQPVPGFGSITITPGTAVRFPQAIIAAVSFRANPYNAGISAISGSDVDATSDPIIGTPLEPGDTIEFMGKKDLSSFYMDSAIAGDSVSGTYTPHD